MIEVELKMKLSLAFGTGAGARQWAWPWYLEVLECIDFAEFLERIEDRPSVG